MNDFSYEKYVAIKHHVVKDVQGIGGEIKRLIKDFIVQEVTLDGEALSIHNASYVTKHERKPPRSGRKYTCFVLKKFGVDTIYAIEYLARYLKVPSSKFSFPGIKDNQAITIQQVCVEGDFWYLLKNIARKLPNFEINNIDYCSSPLKTGDLWGNKFLIRIRNIDLSPEECSMRIKQTQVNLEKNGGFLNYFGLQRFGTHRPNSHVVGKHLILGEYEKAIDEMLIPTFPLESEDAKKARNFYKETRDAKKALELFPPSLYYEVRLLEYLSEHPKDYKGAVFALPGAILSIYIFSFQSFLFNKIVNLRLEQVSENIAEPVKGEMVALLDGKHGTPTRVRYVVKENNQDALKKHISLGKACIIIPIIGYKIKITEDNPVSSLYNELLEKENIAIEDFKNMDKAFKARLNGVYRPLALYPRNMKIIDIEKDDINKGKTSCRLSFELPKGTYATMFLREIMKVENQYL
ncbi:MAG: tRNA pseudouridine(13) synthase TruD [Promethearchaeota archaeon]